MSKKSTITNLIVMPLIASAVFLASPAFVSAQGGAARHTEVRNITTSGTPNTKRGVAGTVTSISGNIIIVTSLKNVQYTVDAGTATIMKSSGDSTGNPAIIHIADIKVGDTIVVRGVIKDADIAAEKIFDGKQNAHHKITKRIHHLRQKAAKL